MVTVLLEYFSKGKQSVANLLTPFLKGVSVETNEIPLNPPLKY